MVIEDLDFVQLSERNSATGGYAIAIVSGDAKTGYAEAFASIGSLSFGEKTYSSTETLTDVSWTSFSVTSTANAEGVAIAQKGHSLFHNSARYSSTSIHINYARRRRLIV